MDIQLFELSIDRKKLKIKSLREINLNDLVPVRETLNSIDFILGDDSLWDFIQEPKQWKAVTKLRLYDSDTILKFIEDNKDKLRIDSIDRAFITDLTKVYKIDRHGKSKQDILDNNDLDKVLEGNKNRIIKKINETVENINAMAETMGGIS